MPVDKKTQPLALVDARGRRGMVERMMFGRGESVEQNSRWHQHVPGPQLPGMVSTVTLLAGLWLVVGPMLLAGVEIAGDRPGVRLDFAVGCGLSILGLIRLTRPIRVVHATGLGCVFGTLLVVAPLAVEYGLESSSTIAVVNDVLTGILVLAVTVVGFVDARRRGGFDV